MTATRLRDAVWLGRQNFGVINSASRLKVDMFDYTGRHMRSAVGVFPLPLRYAVKVDAVIEIAA